APEEPALLSVPPTAVAMIELDDRGTRLTAVRDRDRWRDPSGREWPGDAVSDLVATLGTLRPVMVVDPHPTEPADYGLGVPARKLEVHAADGRRVLALELGERNPAWTGVYARRAGEPEVMLIGSVLTW